MMQMFGWEFTEDQLNAFKQMWIATDIDGDYGSRSMMEQINFLLKQWAYFIQNWFQTKLTFNKLSYKNFFPDWRCLFFTHLSSAKFSLLLRKFQIKIKMSNFRHVETTFGELHEIKNVVTNEGRARTIKVLKETAILRPIKNSGKLRIAFLENGFPVRIKTSSYQLHF